MIHVLDSSSSAFHLRTMTSSFSRVHFDKQVERMGKSPLFAGLSLRACGEILQYARKKTFLRNEVLFSQGEISDEWILIQSGRVKMTQVSAEGNEVILWMLGAADALGVQAGTNEFWHTCSARAMERCETLVMDRKAIHLVLSRHPQIRSNIGGILTARLRELEERFCEIASESVAQRLARLLLRLCRSAEKKNLGGIELRLRRQELAQMTGTTLFTVSRIFSKWADLGLVASGRGIITVRESLGKYYRLSESDTSAGPIAVGEYPARRSGSSGR